LPLQLMLLTLGCVLLVFMWRLKEAEALPVRVKK